MLVRYRDATTIYRGLIRRGVEAIAFDDCGEGLAWARGLIADCWYRLAGCQSKMGVGRMQFVAMSGTLTCVGLDAVQFTQSAMLGKNYTT